MAAEDEVVVVAAEPQPEPDPPPPCPECKAGVPAWMCTFADMATLLMAFFVLILSFAHVNVPKYKEVSGSMRTAFGVQNIIPVIEPPKADNIVVQQYMSAQVDPTALRTVEEQRTDVPQPEEEELRTDTGEGEKPQSTTEQALEEVLAQQIAEGKVRVTTTDNKVQVELLQNMEARAEGEQAGDRRGQVNQDTLEIFAAVAAAQTSTTADIEVIDSSMTGASAVGSDGTAQQGTARESLAESQYEQIRASLAREIEAGLAQVEREGDKVLIRLAEQGSFDSGQAALKGEFEALLARVGVSLAGSSGLVTIEGHTDDVPLGFGSRYRTNWDLSAARAAGTHTTPSSSAPITS
ncbi:MAG: flagellar motor protein MotB, partial [Pseudohongiellaceae bacterium]